MGTPVPVLSQSAEGYVQPVATTDEVSFGKIDVNGVGGGDMVGISLGAGMRITGVPTTPTADTDAVNKAYVDSVAQGLVVKQPVEAVAIAPITGTPPTGLPLLDYEYLNDGDRVLLVDQANAVYNGIWVAHGTMAQMALTGAGSGNITSVLQSVPGGTLGNSITFATVADGTGTGSITVSGQAVTFHYQTGVTTVANMEAAISNLINGTFANWLLTVNTAGASHTMTAPGDTFTAFSVTTPGTDVVWTRPADFAAGAHAEGAFVLDIGPDPLEPGNALSTLKGSGWVCTSVNPNDVIGPPSGNNLVWVEFSGAQNITASHGCYMNGQDVRANPGDGLSLDGASEPQHFQIALDSNPGLQLLGTSPSKLLSAKPDTARGLSKDGNGLYIELEAGTSPYPSLHFDAGNGGALDVKVKANAGLVTDSGGLGVKVDSVVNNIAISSGATGGLYATGVPACVNNFTAAGGIATAACVYAAGNSTVSQASYNSDATSRILGIATAPITNGNAGPIVSEGPALGVLAGTGQYGVPYYLGPTGLLVLAAGVPNGGTKRYIEVGIGLNANDLWVDIKDYGKKA